MTSVRAVFVVLSVSLLVLPSTGPAAEPARVDLGTTTSGQIVPRIAVGDDQWSTEFQIFNLDAVEHDVSLAFVDANTMSADPAAVTGLPLELFDVTGNSLGEPSAEFMTTVPSNGSVTLRTSSSRELRTGFAVFRSARGSGLGLPGIQEVGINTVIMRSVEGADFRTSVPAVPPYQERMRLPFLYTGGRVTCLALTSLVVPSQAVTLIARDPGGQEMCRTSSTQQGIRHEAFCLADRLFCVAGQDGTVEIVGENGGLAAIGLAADQTFRLWTSTPYELLGGEEDCVEWPEGVPLFESIHNISEVFGGAGGLPRPTDRLVTGTTTDEALFRGPLPESEDQRFCGQVDLVPGFPADVYVPTEDERSGDFSGYRPPVIDPVTGDPFPNNVVPSTRLGEVFALRIHSPAR